MLVFVEYVGYVEPGRPLVVRDVRLGVVVVVDRAHRAGVVAKRREGGGGGAGRRAGGAGGRGG